MATINVDGQQYEVKEGQNLLHAVLSQQLNLPYFCWHPAMGSVGACRQCAVIQYADEDDERGRLGMACMTDVVDGMRISIEAPQATDFRESVIEWLMENHPHDCPVCEEGGECHLQDMTVMTGHSVRKYRGTKRTWENQNLGPFIGHEMNRCITCFRCVRYYRDYAGGTDLSAFGSRSRMYFGRSEDGPLESEFSGNLVEVCPTGVFTDKPFATHYTRKWDLQSAPSVCPGCAVGCNVFPGERYGVLKRVQNRYHGEVNGYFLCDRGRFGSHFINSDQRIRRAGIRADDGIFEASGASNAVAEAAKLAKTNAIGIGSPRASFEANFALKKLVGEERFCTGLSDNEAMLIELALSIQREGSARTPSLTDVEAADAILILGEDVLNTAPRIALAVRQAVRGESLSMAEEAGIPGWQDAGVRGHAQQALSPLYIASVAATRIDDVATATFGSAPQDIARVGAAIAHEIDSNYAAADIELSTTGNDFSRQVVEALGSAKRPLIVSGTGTGDPDVLRAAANVAWALKAQGSDPALLLSPMEANSYGVALLGGGLSMADALDAMTDGSPAIVMENDLYRRGDAQRVTAACRESKMLVLDILENETAEHAAVLLPASTYAECTGTYVNYETRAQRFYQVFEPDDEIRPAWRWISDIADALDSSGAGWANINVLIEECAKATHAVLATISPPSDYRVEGGSRIPRQPHRYSGRTAMRAQISVHEPKATVDDETPFNYSMEGQNLGTQDGAAVPFVWSPGWNSNQSVFKFQQEVGGALLGGDPGTLLVVPESDSDEASRATKFRDVPDAFVATEAFLVVPIHAIFGSDELSNASWPLASRIPAPFALLNIADANRLGVQGGGGVSGPGLDASLEVLIDDRIPAGVVGVVHGLPGTRTMPTGRIELSVDSNFVRRPNGTSDVIARG